VPVYGAPDELRECLVSLVAHAPEVCTVWVLDDASPGDRVAAVVADFASAPGFHYVRRTENLGFVANCNAGIAAALPSGDDILLLNSDTRITAGAIEELAKVLHLHEKHGCATPRSNNATVYSVPVFERFEPEASFQLWRQLRPLYPRFQVMPTAVGFAMLIRNEVLAHFGSFDEIYSPGYNEENDLVCRMNRHGYSAVMANYAFVYHFEGASFGGRRKKLEQGNRVILDGRYPEYSRVVSEHFRIFMDPVDRFAALWAPHRKRILFDLYHLPAKYSGTCEFALNLLLHLAPLLEADYELQIGLSGEARSFFESDLVGYTIFDETRTPEERFDLVFKPCQLFQWEEMHRMARLGARVCYTQQDSIAVRCRYLSAANVVILQGCSPDLADRVITISKFSQTDFEAFYDKPVNFEVIHQGTQPTYIQEARPVEPRILVVGNQYQHKGVHQAVSSLRGLSKIAVLGGEPDEPLSPDIEWARSGALGRTEIAEMLVNATVVVYPSYFEGFGLPVLDALALGRPVVVLAMEVSRELAALTKDPNLHLAATHTEMRSLVETLLQGAAHAAQPQRTWKDVAVDYARSLTEVVERPIDAGLLRRRWRLVSMLDAFRPLQ